MADKKPEVKKIRISGLTAETALQLTTKNGSFTKEQLDSAVWAKVQKSGITINARGKTISEDRVKAQNGAWLRDVFKSRQGWWAGYTGVKLEDDKMTVKAVKKAE